MPKEIQFFNRNGKGTEVITYWVGNCAQDNFDLIDEADPEDYWFHANDGPSAHVIVSLPETIKDKKEKRCIIKKGAELAKQHSSFKSNKNVTVIYTKIKNITKTDIIGTVNVTNPQYIQI
jgi:predicted ribosome quality control (RQC) complex YloA/Tae2 family protein